MSILYYGLIILIPLLLTAVTVISYLGTILIKRVEISVNIHSVRDM